MRVGDADRAAIADRLAEHFSNGRLDEAEFSDRLDRALRAKTMADLTGLLADLPDDSQAGPAPTGRQRRKLARVQLEREQLKLRHEQRHHREAERRARTQKLRWVLVAIAAIAAVTILAHVLTHSVGAWLLVGLIGFLWLRRKDSTYRGD
jgi:Flp pilus assembly protein TadB